MASPNKTFEVNIYKRELFPSDLAKETVIPDWVTQTIVIKEKHLDTLKRIIIIGINEKLKTPSEGHTEILSIIINS